MRLKSAEFSRPGGTCSVVGGDSPRNPATGTTPRLSKILSVAVCFALGGCSVIPSSMPAPGSGDLTKFGGVYPVLTTRDAVVGQARQYMADWRNRQDSLEFERDVNSNMGVVAAVFAAISGVRGRVHDAKVGAALAGGSALYNSTYQPASLGDIYGNGAGIMECIMIDLQGLSPMIDELYSQGTLKLPRSEFKNDASQADAQAAWDKLQSLWLDINISMSAAVNKVRANAIAHAITVPKVTDLQDKLKAATQAEVDAAKQATAAAQPAAAVKMAGEGNSIESKRLAMVNQAKEQWALVPEAAKAYAIALSKKLATCTP